MMRCLVLSLLVGSLFSCKADKEKPTATPVSAETKEQTEEVVEQPVAPAAAIELLSIKAAKLVLTKGEGSTKGPESLSIDAEGVVRAADKALGKLASDGKLVDMDGKLLASIDAEGTLRISGSEEIVVIGADGSITHQGAQKVTIGADGEVELTDVKDKAVYTGPEEAKRAMMIVLAVWLTYSEESVTTPF